LRLPALTERAAGCTAEGRLATRCDLLRGDEPFCDGRCSEPSLTGECFYDFAVDDFAVDDFAVDREPHLSVRASPEIDGVFFREGEAPAEPRRDDSVTIVPTRSPAGARANVFSQWGELSVVRCRRCLRA